MQVEAQTAFRFTNTGTEPVDILSVQTTCGCLKAVASTNRIASGESSAIVATFDFRDKAGPQRKSVAVRSSDSKPVILYVEANIKSPYGLSAQRLEWPLSGERAPQTCRLINQYETPFNLISATASSDQFNVELVPVREGFEYEVLVTPDASIQAPTLATITVHSQCPPELQESRVYTLTAVLR